MPSDTDEAPKKTIKGRGTAENPTNRFASYQKVETLDDLSQEDEENLSVRPQTQFLNDSSRSIVAENQSPDVGFSASINPYRGCEHGCIYCYARPTHEYLGFSPGLDFETKILIKRNAPQLLRETLAKKTWEPKVLAISGVTDCYQPIERDLKLTRQCLEVLLEFRNPVAIITKNFLVTRDVDLLASLASFKGALVFLSITTLDHKLCGVLEPRTARPAKRLEALRILSEAGIPVGVNIAPVIPGLTDHEMPQILEAAYAAGARHAGFVPLRLPLGVAPLFEQWLEDHYPNSKEKVLSRVRALRGGKLNDANFGSRMRGEGVFAEQMKSLFKVWTRKLGYHKGEEVLSTEAFLRPPQKREQLDLFG